MKTVTIHSAKTNLSRLIEEACKGEDIVIARDKKPMVRLVPVCSESGDRKPGWLKGRFKLGPEFFEPLPAEELDLWWK
jgi:antitoxin (DNA-binding transcriptional repressor) of toxin-antitoxin stability system